MQKNILIMLLSSLSFAAGAVRVTDCPERLSFSIQSIALDQEAPSKILENIEFTVGSDEAQYLLKEILGTLKDSRDILRTFTRSKAESGVCFYESQENPNGAERFEIYTKGGVDRIYMQTRLGVRGIALRAYGRISSLSPEEIELAPASLGIAIGVPLHFPDYSADFSIGGSLVFVGMSESYEVLAVR